MVFFLACLPRLLSSLPQGAIVEEGRVHMDSSTPDTMVIDASHKSVIRYQSFNVGQGEKVRFIQPSASSAVLNRVEGKSPSQILGSIESNGKVFLLNSHGIYFGKEAVISVGSLVASTLAISNEDFLQDRFCFHLEDTNYLSEIYNEGLLSAGAGGEVVLIAPVIRNLGQIQATAGKVILASAEHVTLDFLGNGLLEFTVEGDIKNSLIGHLGSIQAEGGEISMRLPIARKVIHEIVNHEGVERGQVFIMEEGEISLVAASSLVADHISLEADHIKIEGSIDASNKKSSGGMVRVNGSEVAVEGASFNVSGHLGGGNILVEGNSITVDRKSELKASCESTGPGGSVVLISQESLQFDGVVIARGGIDGGNGGFIETSSKGRLLVGQATMDAFSPKGQTGKWLLDPTTLRITAGGTDPLIECNPVDSIVSAATIENALSTVVLCANQIIQEVPLSMNEVGVGITFTAPPGEQGILMLQGGTISTKSGAIEVNNLQTIIAKDSYISTIADGGLGANVSFGIVEGPGFFTFAAGEAGVITLSTLGNSVPLRGIRILNAGNAFLEDVSVRTALEVLSPITLTKEMTTFSILSKINNSYLEVNTVDGVGVEAQSLTINTGPKATLATGKLGAKVPLKDITIQSNAEVSLGDIQASSFLMTGGIGKAIFRDDVNLSSSSGFQVSARLILLGGIVIANNVNFVSIGPISKSSIRQKMFLGDGISVMNSLKGSVGTQNYPLNLTLGGSIVLGASKVISLSGAIPTSSITYIPGNKPCKVFINGVNLVNCSHKPKMPPKGLFASVDDMNPVTLGIGYSPLSYQNTGVMTQFENVFDLTNEDAFVYQAMDL